MSKRIVSLIIVLTMITGLLTGFGTDGAVKAQAAGTATILNNGFFYGKNMNDSSVTLVIEASGESLQYQWQKADSKTGSFSNIEGATGAEYTLSPENGKWYRCVVNGSANSEALQVLKNGEGFSFNKPCGCFYIGNGAMAYSINSVHFDIVGLYNNGSSQVWIETSYSGSWQYCTSDSMTPDVAGSSGTADKKIKSFKAFFDKSNDVVVKFEVTLEDNTHSFGFGCDTQLNRKDSCYLGATLDNSGKLKQVQMIASNTYDAAEDTTAAFVIVPQTQESHFWLGGYSQRRYWTVANGYKEEKTYVNANNESMTATTTVENTDSGMTMSWNNLAGGTTVKFQFNVGSVSSTGAKAAEAAVSATNIEIKSTHEDTYYQLFEKVENGTDVAVTAWMIGTGEDILVSDLQANTKYYVVTVSKEAFEAHAVNNNINLAEIDEEQKTQGEDLLTAIDANEGFTDENTGVAIHTNFTAGSTLIRVKNPNPKYKYGLKKGSSTVYSCAAPNDNGNYVFENLTPDTDYSVIAICEDTNNSNCEPVTVRTLLEGQREEYIIGSDALLPYGSKYGEIDYDTDFIKDNIFYAKDSAGNTLVNTYINLTTETFSTDLDYDYYSRNGGKSWIKGKMTSKKLQSYFNSGLTLVLCKGNCNDKENRVLYTFDAIAKRPRVQICKVDYLIYADASGLTNGMWTLTYRGSEIEKNTFLVGEGDSKGKELGYKGFGLLPEEDGIWIEDPATEGKVTYKYYFYKIATHDNVPASATKKLKVSSLIQPVNSKANYTYETINVSRNNTIYFGDTIPDTRADSEKLIKSTDTFPFEEPASTVSDYSDLAGKAYYTHTSLIKVDLSKYLTIDRNTVLMWKQATSSKPASVKKVISLASRGEMDQVSFTGKNGRVTIKNSSNSYVVYLEDKGKWSSSLPKYTESCIVKIRVRTSAKGGKESNSTHTWGIEGYLVCICGVYNEKYGYKGVLSATTYLTLEEAEAALEAANAAANQTEPE